jgi:antitoxin (DNA-binding transcriptional repressor) of toxin-antitoxin stability system
MRAVGIKSLKNRLSEYVRLAAAGETVLVTDRDQVVAQLGPPDGARSRAVADALLADAVREGLVTPASLPPAPPPETARVAPLETILDELAADREDR